MSPIENKVRAARRRLVLGRFAGQLCWTLAVAWLVAGIAIALGAFWSPPSDLPAWSLAWIAASSGIAALVAAVWCWSTRPSLLSVASEIDQRFATKQRLGSVLAMREPERQSAMGKALIEDAARRAETLQIAEKFRLSPTRLGWLPAGSAVLVAMAFFIGPAVTTSASGKPTTEMLAQAEQLKKSTEVLKKKLSDQRKKAEAAGLKDAAEMFTRLEADVEKLEKRDTIDPKQALIAINDLKKQLDERRKQLGSPESMRQTLAKMSESEKGPAESIVKAMKEGDFEQAKEQAKALAEKIRNQQLTPEEKKALQAQVEKLRDQMRQAAEKHEAEKQQLQKQIDEAKREGRGEEAAKLQQQLNELQTKDSQMQQMQQMAESMSAAAEAMGQGDSEQAAEALEGMADQLGDMQEAMEQLQDIEETLDTLSQSKDQMRCKSCSGQGCSKCQGDGLGNDGRPSDGSGKGGSRYGLGKGSGLSGPEEQDDDAQHYQSQVRGDPKQGRGVNAGFADGPNRKGVTREDVKQAVLSAISDESDPLENQTLPRTEREHAKEYFDKLRAGK
ncbi:MAG: hypothetical protein ACO1RT_08415 [Planctomycetaceae bacterium]